MRIILCLLAVLFTACQTPPPSINNSQEHNAEDKKSAADLQTPPSGTIKIDQSARGEIPVAVAHTLKKSDFSPADRQGTTLVYFAKTVCDACIKQEPAWEFVVKNAPSGVTVKKVFEHQVDLDWYAIPTHPTFIIFQDGREVWRFVGIAEAYKLLDALKR